MQLDKELNILSENKKVKIRKLGGEIIIHLDLDVISIHPRTKTVQFLDIDSTNKSDLKNKYYNEFPEVESLYKVLIEEDYNIEP